MSSIKLQEIIDYFSKKILTWFCYLKDFFKAPHTKQEVKELTVKQEVKELTISPTNNREEIQKIIRKFTNKQEVINYFLKEILTPCCDLRNFFELLCMELERIGWALSDTEYDEISLKVDDAYDSMMNYDYDPFDAYDSMMEDFYDEEFKKIVFS